VDAYAPLLINKDIVISSFNTIDYYNLKKDFYQLPDSHTYWEMVYVDRGDVISNYGGVGHTLSAGQVVFHPPHSSHSHISNKKVSSSVLVISFVSESELLKKLQRKIYTVTSGSKKILSLFLDECKNAIGDITNTTSGIPKALTLIDNHIGATQLMECYFLEFLYSLIRTESFETLKKTEESRTIVSTTFAELLKSYLLDNIHKNITLSDLCKKFNVSQSSLCKKWKDYSGVGLIEYFINLKMDEAKSMIRLGELNISQISDSLGYATIHHFSNSFKKATGMSPSEYKKSVM